MPVGENSSLSQPGAGATTGSIKVVSTTPYLDAYHYGEKYLLIGDSWVEQRYEDICMVISTRTECEVLGWCEYEYMDNLWCERALVKIDLPGFGLIAGKLVDYKASKKTNEPFAWIPFNIIIEEIDLEQLSG